MKLDLNDLQPAEAPFSLSNGKTYTLKKFTLATQIWLQRKFGQENIQGIFTELKIPEISEIVFYLLKDKQDFKTVEDLQENIVTQKDRVELIQALLTTIGLSQPVLEKLNESEAQSPSQPIGAQATTS